MVERTLISFPSQLQLIERLQHLLYLSSSMVFISGEKGSGKSTLVEQLSNQLPGNTQQAFITLSEPTSAAQMRQLIISQLYEHPLFDADDTLTNILLLLNENQQPNIARVIVIDNAKLLPAEFINELADVIKQKLLLSDNEINFILLSEESTNKQMVHSINAVQNNQDIATLTFKLIPLNAQEANQLINHRFAQIGYSPEIQHKDALAKQLAHCNGVPKKILSLATELSDGDLAFDNPSWLKTRFPAILLMLLLVAIASALATYLYPKLVKSRVEVETIVETQDDFLEEIVGIGLVADEVSEARTTEILAGNWSTDDDLLTDDTKLSVGEADNQERVTISDQQLIELVTFEEKSQAVSSSPATIADRSEKEVVLPAEPEKKTDIPILADKENTPPEVIVAFTRVTELVVEKLPAVVVDPALQPTAPIAPVVPAITETESVILPIDELSLSELDVVHEVFALQELDITATVNQAEKTEYVQATTAIEETYNDAFTPASSLLAINESKFTLQLTGMSSTKSLQEFISTHQLPRENVYLYKTLRNKKPWYVVIYGQFESRNIANNAAKNLPGTLSNMGTWAKNYASVHQDLLLNE